MYDLIILGGGPAAISAGIYASRKKLKTLLIAKNWGGQTALAPWVENYPGFAGIKGLDLVNNFVEQLKKNELEIKEGEEAKEVKITENGSVVEIKTASGHEQANALIVATGRLPRQLGLAEEEKFIGKGISYCATCDAPLFKNKSVAVIGGANAGLSIALELSQYASRVYILKRPSESMADEYLREKIKQSPQIEFLTNVSVEEIKGDKFVEGLVYREKDGARKEIAVQGIFVVIGSIANSSFLKDVVKLNKSGEIKIDRCNQTSQPNIFAAGDVTDVSHKQIVIAVGEGAKAALNAYQYLKQTNYASRKNSFTHSCF